MHFLSGVRFYGFTVFGFWIPIIFWSFYAVLCAWNVIHSKRGGDALTFLRDATLIGVASILMTSFVLRGSMVGLSDIVSVSVIPTYFLFFRKNVGYMQIAGITYLSTLVSDVVGSPFMGDLHAGWLPQLLLTHPYHPILADYQCIGGSGLLDGLLIDPLNAVLIVFLTRVLWVYIHTHRSGQKVVWYNIT